MLSLKVTFVPKAYGQFLLPASHEDVFISFSYRGVISRFPLLSGVVASGVFLAVSFTVLAISLIPSFWWRYGDRDPVIAKAEPTARPRVPPDALSEKRARRRSLKRSGSVGPVKREV